MLNSDNFTNVYCALRYNYASDTANRYFSMHIDTFVSTALCICLPPVTLPINL